MVSEDLLGFFVPSEITALGGRQLLSTSGEFRAGIIEAELYLGLPLIAMIALGAHAGWRALRVKVMVAVLMVVVVCTLGPHLHVAGSSIIPLPWTVVQSLPCSA